jgi:hypothetical protein
MQRMLLRPTFSTSELPQASQLQPIGNEASGKADAPQSNLTRLVSSLHCRLRVLEHSRTAAEAGSSAAGDGGEEAAAAQLETLVNAIDADLEEDVWSELAEATDDMMDGCHVAGKVLKRGVGDGG